MAEKVRYLSDLELYGNMAFALPVTDFPQSAAIGTVVLKGTALYCYLKLGDLETWFPFAKETNSYVHTQGVAANTWTVNHNLGTANIWYQVRDENGAIQQVGKTDVSVNTFTLNFTCPMLGTVVVVAPDSINVPEVKASSISISNNVIIDNSGVRVNGNYVLTSANIATQIATAVAGETDKAVTAETSLSTATAAVATNLTSERNRALTAESNLSTDISNVSTSVTTERDRALAAEGSLSTDISTHATDSSIHTTMEQVNSAIQDIVGAAPAALDTLKEIADQLANDESAVSVLTTVVSGKVDKVTGFALSSNDYTSTEKSKLAGIESGAQVNTVTSVAGKTGTVTLNKNDIGLTDVDNTSDDKKPISTYTQLALDTKAPTNNPTFTGTVSGITKTMIGLGNVDNTSDSSKPISTATQVALNGKEPSISTGTSSQYYRGDKVWASLSSVATSGSYTDLTDKPTIPVVPTKVSAFTNDSNYQTATQVNSSIQAIVGAAPVALDTLVEIATQLANDESAVSALTTVVSGKAPLNSPTFTGNVTGLGIATGTSFNSITGLASTAPLIAGTSAVGTSTLAARQDHVHPEQTTITGNAGTATTLATGRTISITGDLTYTSPTFNGSGNVTAAGTLANSGITAGTYNNSATAVKPIIFDAKGKATGVGTDVTITPAWSSITNKPTTLSGYGITDGLTLGNVVGAANGTASAGIATTAARSDHVHPNSSIVVNTPVVTGSTNTPIGQNYTLSFNATSGLSGGSITSFTVTKPDSTIQTVTASSNAGTLVWAATGTTGQVKTFTVVANDNLGNSSASATFSLTLATTFVNAPSITSPSANATGMLNTFTMSTGQLSLTPATGFTDTHQYTDWEIWTGDNRSGTLVWSSINDATNKTTITVPNTAGLVVSTTYYIAVRHKGTTYGWGGYAYSTFTTASQFVPTVAGTAYEGGFYAGRIVISGLTYALVVSPKSSGNTTKQWKTTNDTTAGTLSLNDGLSNSNAMNNASHPAAQFCRGLTIASKSDWYLPSRDELEVCYRNLKPTTASNTVYASRLTYWGVSAGTYNGVDAQGNGDNDYSVDASGAYNGAAYTASSPAQTAATAFQAGGTECFDTAWYWSSTEFNATYAWFQYFDGGYRSFSGKTGTYSVRAVRKVLI